MSSLDIFRPDSPRPRQHNSDILSLVGRVQLASSFLHHEQGAPYTPLVRSDSLSRATGANVRLKMESKSDTGAYKGRGSGFALRDKTRATTASAGNHAQGFALGCQKNGVEGTIFMPAATPDFKVARTRRFGGDKVEVHLIGDTFDAAAAAMKEHASANNIPIVHPFDDRDVIGGQGTIAIEILHQMQGDRTDFVIIPIGGGGISAGMATWFAINSPGTQIIAVEPTGADAMKKSLEAGHIITLPHLDTFVDGAAVKTPGVRNFNTLRALPNVHYMTVSSGAVSMTMCELHDDGKEVVEPAGALSVTALKKLQQQSGYDFRGKNVVCVVTGGNIGMERWPNIRQRANEYLGYEREFKIKVRNTPGELRNILERFVDGNQITMLRFDNLEGAGYVAFTIRLRNIGNAHKIQEFEKAIIAEGLLWGDRPEESVIASHDEYPYRKNLTLKLPNRPGALLEALCFQGSDTNIIAFDHHDNGFIEARCFITVASKTESELRVFVESLRTHGFYQ